MKAQVKAVFRLLVTAALPALVCCGDPDTAVAEGTAGGMFVDVAELVDEQARRLDSVRPEVQKIIAADGKDERLQTRRLSWARELAIFKELNLDKPGLRAGYLVSGPAPHLRLFTRKPGEHAELQWLKVSFDAAGRLQALEGVTGRSNYLYHSGKHLGLWFTSDAQGRNWLAGYRIENRKRILFSDEEVVRIETRVNY